MFTGNSPQSKKISNKGMLFMGAALVLIFLFAFGFANATSNDSLKLADEAPVVTVTSPLNGTTVSGNIPFTADASDDNGIAGVLFVIDDFAYGDEDTSAPYGVDLDTTLLSNGWHYLDAIARSNDEGLTTSFGTLVYVDNAIPSNSTDTILPVIQVYSPQSLTYDTNQILVDFSASDESGIASTSFMNDTGITGYSGATTQYASEGQHTWTFMAEDNAGNQNQMSVTFNVDLSPNGNESLNCTEPSYTEGKFVYFACPTLASGAEVYADYIIINATTIPANIGNLTVRLYDSDNNLVDSTISNTFSSLYVNYSDLPSGLYYYNASIDGDNLNSSYFTSETRSITLLSAPPSNGNETNQTINEVPGQVSDLHSVAVFQNSITWSWNSPNDTDFAYSKIYLDGNWVATTNQEIFTAGSLQPGTTHIIAITTVDSEGNVNSNSVFDVETTLGDNNNGNNVPELSITGINSTITYPSVASAMGQGCPNGLVCNLYLDGIKVSNPYSGVLTTGQHFFIFATNGNEDYSEKMVMKEVNVTRDSTQQMASGSNVIVVDENKEVVVPAGTNPVKIIVPQSIDSDEQVILNLALLHNGSNIVVPANLTLVRQTADANYTVIIPAGTVINGPIGWDGKLIMPTLANPSDFTIPSGSFDLVLNLGTHGQLTFSKPVKITLSGMSGKRAAWSSDGSSANSIDLTCNSVNNPSNINSLTQRECSIDSGNDLILWTYHFTSFGAYTASSSQSSEQTSSSGSGGHSGSSGGSTGKTLPVLLGASDSTQKAGQERDTSSEDQNSQSGITGAAIGGGKFRSFALVFVALVIAGLAVVSVRKLREKN